MYKAGRLSLQAASELAGTDRVTFADLLRQEDPLKGLAPLSPDLIRLMEAVLSEMDPEQLKIYRSLSPAERVRQGCSISTLAHQVVAYRREKLKQEHG